MEWHDPPPPPIKKRVRSASFMRGMAILRGEHDALRRPPKPKRSGHRFDSGFPDDFDDTKDEQL